MCVLCCVLDAICHPGDVDKHIAKMIADFPISSIYMQIEISDESGGMKMSLAIQMDMASHS